jgi:DNA repair exonuclease SbcCD ATPase subunit
MTYNKIYHISDIHIRNTEEHVKIYNHVFDNLYEYLESVKNNSGLIVITGDILHNKNKLTPTCETLCIDFFERLSSIMTTIIIAGNHDFNEKNNDNKDSLSSILYKRQFNNLHYLRTSGIYDFNNITFGVSSLIDNQFIKADSITTNNIKIGLYHGPISNSKNSKGFEFSKNSITNFDGYDLVLLGDIHYHQYLNEEKTIAYASSLISQNFSETDINHGVLVWNLETKKSEYKVINNEYRFVEINIPCDLDTLDLPLYGKLKVNSENCDRYVFNKIIANIKKKYPNINIVQNNLITTNLIENNYTSDKTHINYESVENIINSEIKKLPNDIQTLLLSELKETIQSVDEKLNWKLLTLEFSNMFSYGEDNKIDFTKLTFNELTGLIGPNSAGKSSLIDILLFSLFDDYSRNYQDKHKLLGGALINSKEKKFNCKVTFFLDNLIHVIEKEGIRYKAKSENTFDTFNFTHKRFYKFDENNNIISLCEDNSKETTNVIIKHIGDYHDFCLSSVCLQNNNRVMYDFPSMTPRERKTFLNERLKIKIFEKIETKYKNLLRDEKYKLKTLNNLNEIENYNYNIDEDINNLNDKIKLYDINSLQYTKQIDKLNTKLDNNIKKLKYINDKYSQYSINYLKELILLEEETINDIPSHDYTSDEYIDKLYNDNLLLTSNIKQISTNYECKLSIDKYKNKLSKLNLVINKDNIIKNHEFFEKQKIDKLITLKSQLKMDINYGKIIPKHIIDQFKTIYNLISIPKKEYNNIVPEENIYAQHIVNTLNFTNNIPDDIKILYSSISYDKYYKEKMLELQKYEYIKELYLIAESNKDILIMLDHFNNNINHECNNCVNHSTNINHMYSSILKRTQTQSHIQPSNYESIKNKFDKLSKIKTEFELINNYHNNIKLKIAKLSLEIYSSLNNKSSIDSKETLINNQNIEFKNYLEKSIENMEQNNINIEIYNLENSIDNNYEELLLQFKKYDKYNSIIQNYEDIVYNTNINDKINENNILIDNFKKNKQLYLQAIDKINSIKLYIDNFTYNQEIYHNIDSIKSNISKHNKLIIQINKEYINNKNDYDNLISFRDKYNKTIIKIKQTEYNIQLYQTIIKIVSINNRGSIPRIIINNKLQLIENSVNNILNKFLNKKISITTDIEEIKIMIIDDSKDKIPFGGGMESFIIMLACKIALTQAFNISHPSILFIDEGVSVLDREHINNFNIISEFMKSFYNHIILITHIDSFFDYTVDNINIIKKHVKKTVEIDDKKNSKGKKTTIVKEYDASYVYY